MNQDSVNTVKARSFIRKANSSMSYNRLENAERALECLNQIGWPTDETRQMADEARTLFHMAAEEYAGEMKFADQGNPEPEPGVTVEITVKITDEVNQIVGTGTTSIKVDALIEHSLEDYKDMFEEVLQDAAIEYDYLEGNYNAG